MLIKRRTDVCLTKCQSTFIDATKKKQDKMLNRLTILYQCIKTKFYYKINSMFAFLLYKFSY